MNMTMETANASVCEPVVPAMLGRRGRLRGWLALISSVFIVLSFLLIVGPMGLETDAFKPMADFIEENDINANAYYYTEVDEFFAAERHMRENLALVPGGSHQ